MTLPTKPLGAGGAARGDLPLPRGPRKDSTATLPTVPGSAPVRRTITVRPTRSDRAFVLGARAAAVLTLLVMALIGTFLTIGAVPALRSQGWGVLTENEWLPEADKFGIASLLWGTILIGLFALVVAIPLSLGAALFISEYAPRSLKKPLI